VRIIFGARSTFLFLCQIRAKLWTDVNIAEMVKDRNAILSVLEPISGGSTTRILQSLLNGSCMTYFLDSGQKVYIRGSMWITCK